MDLGLAESEFWNLTPVEFEYLAERLYEHRRAADLRAGVLASLIYNANRRPHTKALGATDFFSSIAETGSAAASPREQTPEEQLAIFKQMFGGRIKFKNAN